MKLFACTLPLLAGIPSVLSAQVSVSLPKIQRPVVRAALGPISLAATLNGHGVTVRARAGSSAGRPVARAPRGSTAGASAARVLATAESYLGDKYVYGGESPGTGFDCSGFVQYVFGRHGVALPRTSRQQAGAGRAIARTVATLKPGDLMLFSSKGGGRVDHVAIYAGNNRILHSSAGAGGVISDDLSTPRGKWYLARHVASRRVL